MYGDAISYGGGLSDVLFTIATSTTTILAIRYLVHHDC